MLHELLGSSPALDSVRQQLARLTGRQTAPQRRLPPVLIQGETGTGKGLIAQLVHKHGPRAGASFVDINCAAIPETLLEAELFGYERGAFTDARHAKPGLLQVAHRGTIFLDEIGLMPESLQAKLLKVLEDRAVRRLGSTRSEPADAWVLAATSEDLAAAIRARRFREDLYHRLAVVTVHLPPLRERGTDVLLLARHFLGRACAEYGVPPRTLTQAAEQALTAYPWPGNVRELANVMERVALLADAGPVAAADLGLVTGTAVRGRTAPDPEPVDDQLTTLERRRIEEALHATSWNISRAAARLGLARNTLRYRMERHGLIDAPDAPRRRHRPGTLAADAGGDMPPARPTSKPAASVRWQRSRVTLLRADVLHAGPAPEHARSRLAELLAGKAAGFGGRVIGLDPDRMEAAFGLDAVEHAPLHAAHAALAMLHAARTHRTSAPSPADVRVTIHASEMLVGRLDERVELDIDGRRAAEEVLEHLRAAAPAHPIVISADLRPFLERRFSLEPADAIGGPVQPWTMTGLADAGRPGAPLVSRARELALLQELLDHVHAGQGQSVLLTGDPGVGKTRLLQELRERTHGTGWLMGSAVSFGAALPFHPLIDLLKQAFGVQPSDTDSTIAARIERATASLGEEVHGTAHFLRALLSAEGNDPELARMDPKLRRAGIFDAVRQLLRATARTQPLVLVLEDVHWADPATAEFLPVLVESVASERILLCATQRSGFPLPFGDGVFATRLAIRRVSDADTRAIAAALLGSTSLQPDLQQLIEARAEGNPFFIEEIVRSLRERGLLTRVDDSVGLRGAVDATDVPSTVQDVILARLERLDPGAREMLHLASVVGREFPRRVLERVLPATDPSLDARLESVTSAELVSRARVFPEEIHTFRHALIHDVAYHAQPELQRQTWHARIGDAIEQVYADRLPDHAGVLAHHYTRAQRWDKALPYLLSAARQAERSFATREALTLYDEARRAAEALSGGMADPATLIAIHEARARLFFVTSDFERSAAEGERILSLARLTGNRVKESEALATIAWASTWGRHLDAAIRSAREALAVAEPAGALAVQGRAHFTIGFVQGVTGVLDESQQSLERAIALSSAADDPVHHSLSLSSAGLLKNWTGHFAEAAALQDEGLALARERGLLVPLLFSCFLRGLTLTGRGSYDEALATYTEGLALAERVGDEAIHHRLLNCLGWLYADLGDLDQAEALNTRSASIGRRRRDPGTQPNAELNLADLHLARGDVQTARELYDGVHRYWKDPGTSHWMRFRYSIRMFAGMGELALATGDLATARTHGAECLELATRTGSRKNLVKGLRLSAAIARAERNLDRAEEQLRRARSLAAAVGNPVQSWKTELALADLLSTSGREDEARDAWQQARGILQRVHDGLQDGRLIEAVRGSRFGVLGSRSVPGSGF